MTEKDTIIYQQNCEEFRSLNGFFWQVPLIMMTLNGGLWYSVASLDLSVNAQRGMLLFAAFANVVMIFGLQRIRNIMDNLLTAIHKYQSTEAPGRARVVQRLFQTLLLSAAVGAFAAAWDPAAYFIKSASDQNGTSLTSSGGGEVAPMVEPLPATPPS
jgi:hypothetical protein